MFKVITYRQMSMLLKLIFATGVMFAMWWSVEQAHASTVNDPIKVYIDTEELTLDIDPLLKGGTTLVPFRPFFEALDLEVEWNAIEKSVTGTNDQLTILLKIGEKNAIVNGQSLPLLQPAQIIDERTFVPLRFIGEATGAFVVWDRFEFSVNVVTTEYMETNQLTIEQLEEAIAEYFANQEQEVTEDDDATSTPSDSIASVDLNNLSGMYYGFRSDFGGYECGGICWDFYTFLPDNQIFIGVPENGGPETIDCQVMECFNYTINGDWLELSNGEALPIEIADSGHLMIRNVNLDTVEPVASGTTIDNEYKYLGYRGLIGIDAAASSWNYYLTLKSDGTYETSNFALGSLGATSGGVSTHVSLNDETTTGTYEIDGNTITMTAVDGTVSKSLFFIHNTSDGNNDDIQIGPLNFYTD